MRRKGDDRGMIEERKRDRENRVMKGMEVEGERKMERERDDEGE